MLKCFNAVEMIKNSCCWQVKLKMSSCFSGVKLLFSLFFSISQRKSENQSRFNEARHNLPSTPASCVSVIRVWPVINTASKRSALSYPGPVLSAWKGFPSVLARKMAVFHSYWLLLWALGKISG